MENRILKLGAGLEVNSGSSVFIPFEPLYMEKLLRVASKLVSILHKKCRNIDDAYLVALLVVAFFEEYEKVKINAEGLASLHKFIAGLSTEKSVP